ncbi:N-acetyltransferase family protein [Streptomyces wuyuanensis]|uniref:GNAT family N-acetyltransferase n=1 Tax=Streptomyces wuyuanensis TaxID=1196353 RepID=UPI003D707A73
MTSVITGSPVPPAPRDRARPARGALPRTDRSGRWYVDGVRPGDGPALSALFAGCSPETVRLRFFGLPRRLPREYADSVLACRPEVHDAVVVHHGDRRRLAGLAGLAAPAEADPGAAAVLGVLVADEWQKQGLGRAMVDELLARARRRGVERISATVLPGRSRLLDAMARDLEPESPSLDRDGLTRVYRL